MSLGGNAILSAVVSHAMATGLFERVNGHEPRNAPGGGLTCAVWVDALGTDPEHSSLSTAAAHVVLKLRIYSSMLQQPTDAIDPQIIDAVDVLFTAYVGDFTLGDLAFAVDLLGMSGPRLEAQAGYVTQDGLQLRVMTITLPLIISDVWTESA